MMRSDPVRRDSRRNARSFSSWVTPCVAVFALAACSGGAPRPGDALVEVAAAQRESQLLEPYRVERTVLADRARIIMTGNFYDELVLPALRPGVQNEKRLVLQDGGTEIVFSNALPQSPLKLGIGGLTVLAVEEARIVLLGGRSSFRLDAEFSGKAPVSLLEGATRQDFRAVRIQDGVLSRQP
jgi:xanthine/CO dehydrogenase XdhC/CoxF family maturation factor